MKKHTVLGSYQSLQLLTPKYEVRGAGQGGDC